MAFSPTWSETERAPQGALGYYVVGTLTMDSVNAYVSGGFALTNFGAVTILGVSSLGANTAAQAYYISYNTQTSKLQVYTAINTEFSGTFAAGVTFTIAIIGY